MLLESWGSREQAEAWGEKVMAVRTEARFGDAPPLMGAQQRDQRMLLHLAA